MFMFHSVQFRTVLVYLTSDFRSCFVWQKQLSITVLQNHHLYTVSVFQLVCHVYQYYCITHSCDTCMVMYDVWLTL